MICFRYIIVNSLHKSNNNNNIVITIAGPSGPAV